jgi:hypothetical protein
MRETGGGSARMHDPRGQGRAAYANLNVADNRCALTKAIVIFIASMQSDARGVRIAHDNQATRHARQHLSDDYNDSARRS